MGWFANLFGAPAEEEIEEGAEDELLDEFGYEPEDLEPVELVGCEDLNPDSYCRNTGLVNCYLCHVDDPDRGDPCIDCGNTGQVNCPDCEGRGHIIIDGRGYGN